MADFRNNRDIFVIEKTELGFDCDTGEHWRKTYKERGSFRLVAEYLENNVFHYSEDTAETAQVVVVYKAQRKNRKPSRKVTIGDFRENGFTVTVEAGPLKETYGIVIDNTDEVRLAFDLLRSL